MTTGQDRDDGLEPLTQQALRWVVRLTSGSATQEDARAFESWRAQGVDHEEAFREATAFRRTVRAMDLSLVSQSTTNVTSFRRKVPMMDRRAMLTGGAIAASAAAFMLARPPLGLWPSFAELTADHRTGQSERRKLTPVAGVTVEMNARSALSLERQGHGVDLVVGETFFAVADQSEPFTVDVADQRLSTRSGEFNVRTSDRETCVTCLTGTLERQQRGARRSLKAGEQIIISPDGQTRLAQVDPVRASAWRRGLLVFQDTPLAEAIEDINRYRSGKIILRDNALAARPVNGLFHTNQIDNAVAQIQQLLHLDVTNLPGGVILMG